MRLSFAYQHRQRTLGLDLADHVVKAIQLKRTRHGTTIQAIAEQGVPPGWIVSGEIREPSRVAELIRSLLEHPLDGRFTTRACTIGLPEQKTFVKLLSLQAFEPQQEHEALRWAAAQHIPFAIDEVELDAEPHPELPSPRGQRTYLVGAALKTIVDAYTTLISSAGCQPLALDVESVALARAVASRQDDGMELVLDLGGSQTTACLTFRGVVIVSSSHPFSGSGLTEAIAHHLKLTPADAEKAKRIFGLKTDKGHARIRQTLLPAFESLVGHINELRTFAATHVGGFPALKRIRLVGGGALLNGIQDVIRERLKLPTDFATMPVYQPGSNRQLPLGLRLRFATAIGLALSQSSFP